MFAAYAGIEYLPAILTLMELGMCEELHSAATAGMSMMARVMNEVMPAPLGATNWLKRPVTILTKTMADGIRMSAGRT